MVAIKPGVVANNHMKGWGEVDSRLRGLTGFELELKGPDMSRVAVTRGSLEPPFFSFQGVIVANQALVGDRARITFGLYWSGEGDLAFAIVLAIVEYWYFAICSARKELVPLLASLRVGFSWFGSLDWRNWDLTREALEEETSSWTLSRV
jgi:hypothetical protein